MHGYGGARKRVRDQIAKTCDTLTACGFIILELHAFIVSNWSAVRMEKMKEITGQARSPVFAGARTVFEIWPGCLSSASAQLFSGDN